MSAPTGRSHDRSSSAGAVARAGGTDGRRVPCAPRRGLRNAVAEGTESATQPARRELRADVVVFGGGVAGLWILDVLSRAGLQVVLFEAGALGHGQTVGSQGIIHGGTKYALGGRLSRSAAAIREMPAVWRACLAGQAEPDLRAVERRSDGCFLWRTDSLRSRLGWVGAHIGLKVAPTRVADDALPAILRDFAGAVSWMAEPVVDPRSLLAVLQSCHASRVVAIDPASLGHVVQRGHQTRFSVDTRGDDRAAVRLDVRAARLVLAAGAGNEVLRRRFGLRTDRMQRRPLRMVVLRGPLPEFSGHCVDGAATRVTITSQRRADGTVVWQLGGQIAERGAGLSPQELLALTITELRAVLPSLSIEDLWATTYSAVRAERKTPGGRRPTRPAVLSEGPVVTVWPTKLAFAPIAAELVRESLAGCPCSPGSDLDAVLQDLPRPAVAEFPWDASPHWVPLATQTKRRASAA